jgi:hypothetical protein
MKAQRETHRPQGHSVSYTQLSQPCGLRQKFKRQRVADKDVGVFLLYGRALHAGIDARSKGRALNSEEAVRVAVATFHASLRDERKPISWDDLWEQNLDGTTSADSYGNLCTPEVCDWWLARQIPVYLEHFPDQRVKRAEHRIFVPLTPPPHVTWKGPWSLECWLDREMDDGSIHDIKSGGRPWGDQERRKYRVQALIYMAAYHAEYGRQPSHFEFHVLPRRRGEQEVQVVRVEWDLKAIQAYIDSVIKPQITIIEQEAYVANPGGSLCSKKYCQYWDHCAFGEGTHL